MNSWLPPLVLLRDSNDDLELYQESLYQHFVRDFVESLPQWPNKGVRLKRDPLHRDKEATFWHFISQGPVEKERTIDLHRCERICWPRPMMERFNGRRPTSEDCVIWWKSQRGNEWRYLLAIKDFSHLVVVADRGEYVLPWTHFCIEKPHRRRKLQRECDDYWKAESLKC